VCLLFYSNFFIEKKEAKALGEAHSDPEHKLEVVYRVLKDQLRRIKRDLLDVRRKKDDEKKEVTNLKNRIKKAHNQC
jgi:phage shock protein A